MSLIHAGIPEPSAEQRRSATQLAERARQAVNTFNLDYAIDLLQTCCRLDPANLIYRKSLRQAVRLKYRTRSPSFWRGGLRIWWSRWRLRKALAAQRFAAVLESGEAILSRYPWDTATPLLMAQAAEAWGLPEVGIFVLDQARIDHPRHLGIHRQMAMLLEKQGRFMQAIRHWQEVARLDPADAQAARKVKDLAAVSTIQSGQYDEKTRGEEGVMGRLSGTEESNSTQAKPAIKLKIEGLRKKIAADPRQPQPYVQLAKVLQESDQWEDARTVLERGLADTHQHFDLRLAMESLEIEFFRRDLRLCQEQQKQDPSLPEIRQQVVRLQKEILARELAFYRHQADLMPKDMTLRFELGVRLWQSRLHEEATAEFLLACKDPSLRDRCQIYLGHCFRARRNWPLARKHYEQALAHATAVDDMKHLLFCLAQAAAEHSDWPMAVQFGAELAELDENHEDIGTLLSQWKQHISDPTVAL